MIWGDQEDSETLQANDPKACRLQLLANPDVKNCRWRAKYIILLGWLPCWEGSRWRAKAPDAILEYQNLRVHLEGGEEGSGGSGEKSSVDCRFAVDFGIKSIHSRSSSAILTYPFSRAHKSDVRPYLVSAVLGLMSLRSNSILTTLSCSFMVARMAGLTSFRSSSISRPPHAHSWQPARAVFGSSDLLCRD